MSNRLRIDVIGFDRLQAQIMRLANDRDKKREMIAILRQLAQPTVNAAKQLVPVSKKPHLSSGQRTRQIIQPGSLKKSIGVIVGKRGNARENPTVYVGTRAKGSFLGFYGNWVHEDTNVYSNPGSGRRRFSRNSIRGASNNVGRVKIGNPFLKKAYEQTGGAVTAESERRMAAFIQRRIDRLSTR